MPHVVYVVPCFNEAARLDPERFAALLADDLRLLFVDDGSRDDTRALLQRFVDAHPDRAALHALPHNRGKGEAVRQGLLRALAEGAPFVGYADADLATPVEELARLARLALASPADVLMGSRVARAGASIERRPGRHYLGRVFATYASILLQASVYDTQCGAKVLRATPRLARALEAPFVSRWVFDVELLARLLHDRLDPMPLPSLVEVPLERWQDVGGSHIKPSSVPAIAGDVARATRAIRALRRGSE